MNLEYYAAKIIVYTCANATIERKQLKKTVIWARERQCKQQIKSDENKSTQNSLFIRQARPN